MVQTDFAFVLVFRVSGMRAPQWMLIRQEKTPRWGILHMCHTCCSLYVMYVFKALFVFLLRLFTMPGRRSGAPTNLNSLKSFAKKAFLTWDKVCHIVCFIKAFFSPIRNNNKAIWFFLCSCDWIQEHQWKDPAAKHWRGDVRRPGEPARGCW